MTYTPQMESKLRRFRRSQVRQELTPARKRAGRALRQWQAFNEALPHAVRALKVLAGSFADILIAVARAVRATR